MGREEFFDHARGYAQRQKMLTIYISVCPFFPIFVEDRAQQRMSGACVFDKLVRELMQKIADPILLAPNVQCVIVPIHVSDHCVFVVRGGHTFIQQGDDRFLCQKLSAQNNSPFSRTVIMWSCAPGFKFKVAIFFLTCKICRKT